MNGWNFSKEEALLETEDLTIAYGNEPVLKGINMKVYPNEIVGIVGESGSGKSTLARAIMNLLPRGAIKFSGEIYFEGRKLSQLKKKEWQRLRGNEIAMIFQNPSGYLNPIRRVGSQFIESIRAHQRITAADAEEIAKKTLIKMNLKDPHRVMKSYPFQLSGGMNQRVAIAMATAMAPQLVIADEPTSALDVITQRIIIDEMKNLRDKENTSILMITHHIACAASFADRIIVMKSGRIVEEGTAEIVTKNPLNSYTRSLLESIPRMRKG